MIIIIYKFNNIQESGENIYQAIFKKNKTAHLHVYILLINVVTNKIFNKISQLDYT